MVHQGGTCNPYRRSSPAKAFLGYAQPLAEDLILIKPLGAVPAYRKGGAYSIPPTAACAFRCRGILSWEFAPTFLS